MVRRPTGGKKKKLKHSRAAIEEIEASRNPHSLAMTSTYSKYPNPTVVALIGNQRKATNVIIATPATDASDLNIRMPMFKTSLPVHKASTLHVTLDSLSSQIGRQL
jgi:hypothetical protein